MLLCYYSDMEDGNVLSLASMIITASGVFVGLATLATAVITIFLAIYFNKDKKKAIEETTNSLLDKIANDEDIRNELISKILSNKDFKEEFEKMVDIHTRDKIDALMYYEKEQTKIGELK